MTNLSKKIQPLTPFKRFIMTIGTIPTSYLESMSYAEMLTWFCNFLEEDVIPSINNNAESIIELQEYFKTLNVQTEINNKLDEMAESGTLEEIISAYLDAQSILGFDTIADLKNATNFINGSYARTLGKLAYNDTEGALYKIRLKLETDVIDDNLIVGLTNFDTLVAEKIGDKAIDDLNDEIDTTNENLTTLSNTVNDISNSVTTISCSVTTLSGTVDSLSGTVNTHTNEISDILEQLSPIEQLKGKNFVVFGDSYSQPGIDNSYDEYWVRQVETATGMNRFNYAIAGAGFGRDGNTFQMQLTTAIADMTTDAKNNTKIVIVYGGINDIYNNVLLDTVVNNVDTLVHDIHTNYPNAKIILIPFNWQYGRLTDAINIYCSTAITQMANRCQDVPVVVIKNARFWNIGITSWYRNDAHPSQTGYRSICSHIIGAIYGSPESVEIGETVNLSDTSGGDCNFLHSNGQIYVSLYFRFSSSKTNEDIILNSYLHTLMVPHHDILTPLVLNDGTQIGIVKITNTGTLVATIKGTLNANTYCFMTPLCYKVNAYREWSE